MGNEITKLKNENKRTKTSIQRMKSFQNNQRKVRGGTKEQTEAFLAPDGTLVDKQGRIIGRENYSKCDSERRKHGYPSGDYSEGSADLEQDRSSEQMSEEEFAKQRKSVRNMRNINKGDMLRGVRNAKERVATANGTKRRSGA